MTYAGSLRGTLGTALPEIGTATFVPTAVDLSASSNPTAYTQSGSIAFALSGTATPLPGARVFVRVTGDGSAVTWSADFAARDAEVGLPTSFASGYQYGIEIEWHQAWAGTAKAVVSWAGGPFGIGLVEEWPFHIESPVNATAYGLGQYAFFARTIDSVVVSTDAGTCTVAVAIDGTAVTGMSAISVTSTSGDTVVNATAANAVAGGNTVTLTPSSVSSVGYIRGSLKTTRT